MDGLGGEMSSEKGRPGEAIGATNRTNRRGSVPALSALCFGNKNTEEKKSELVPQTCNLSTQESESGGAP